MQTTPAIAAFAVVATYAMLCPSTDAIMGTGRTVVARFLTLAEAQAEADRRSADGDDDFSYHAELRAHREGEEQYQQPTYSMPELIADAWAFRRDAGAPEWAL